MAWIALMSLMTLSPDVAAANYTIHNNDGSDVEIAIGRLPYHIDLLKNKQSYLQFELVVAYQHTEEVVKIFPEPDENIDARWDTYGAGLGLLYERKLTQNLRIYFHFRPPNNIPLYRSTSFSHHHFL